MPEKHECEMGSIAVENESLRIGLDGRTGAVISVLNKLSGIELISQAEPALPPFELELGLRDEEGERLERLAQGSSFSISRDEDFSGGGSCELRWEIREGLRLTVRMVTEPADGSIRLSPAVLNSSADIMVVSLRYPILRGIGRLSGRGGSSFLAHPQASGFLFKDPYSLFQSGASRGFLSCKYPNGFGAPMQFMAYYAEGVGGFYLACEDPYGTVKDVDFYAPVEKPYLQAAFSHYSWDLHFANSLRLGYPVALAALPEGDWHEAAELYRKWATATGPGHPDWCKKGRLEDKVARSEGSKWLAEEVGFCTFGMPASVDVSRWIEAFHEATGGPVFHVFGIDWPKWAGSPLGHGRMEKACQALGLGAVGDIAVSDLQKAVDSTEGMGQGRGRRFVETLYRKRGMKPPDDYPPEQAEILCEETREFLKETGAATGEPQEWFPSIMDNKNVETLKRLGDHYALFELHSFPYGLDVGKYGLNTWKEGPLAFNPRRETGFAAKWMDPGTAFWRDFHAQRDARACREVGADANYYDISSPAVNESLFSNRTDRLQRPMGWGRKLVEENRELYERTKVATREASGGSYVPQGSEVMAEVYVAELDFAQCRAGGGVQSDMEGIKFLGWMKDGLCRRIPLFTCVYHEYGTIKLDGWAKLSKEFGEIFYYIAAQVALEGGILELDYEFSPLELFADMAPPSYQLRCDIPTHPGLFALPQRVQVPVEEHPRRVDPAKAEFLKEITAARTGFAKDFLAYGAMIRPARLLSGGHAIPMDWKHYNSLMGRREEGIFKAPSIVHYGWSYRNEKLGYVFCNVSPKRQDCEVAIDLRGTPLEGRGVELFQVSAEGEKSLGTFDTGTVSLPLELLPRKVALLEVRPANAPSGDGESSARQRRQR